MTWLNVGGQRSKVKPLMAKVSMSIWGVKVHLLVWNCLFSSTNFKDIVELWRRWGQEITWWCWF